MRGLPAVSKVALQHCSCWGHPSSVSPDGPTCTETPCSVLAPQGPCGLPSITSNPHGWLRPPHIPESAGSNRHSPLGTEMGSRGVPAAPWSCAERPGGEESICQDFPGRIHAQETSHFKPANLSSETFQSVAHEPETLASEEQKRIQGRSRGNCSPEPVTSQGRGLCQVDGCLWDKGSLYQSCNWCCVYSHCD